MKNFLLTSLFALLCTTSHAHAWYEAYTQTTSSNNIKTDISVTATMAVADITITVTNPNKIPIENSLRVYSDILPSGGCEASILNEPIEMDGTTSTYTHTFRLSNLVPNKQYCFQYSGWPPKLFKTDPITTPTGNFFKWPLTVTDPTGQTVVLSGKIDITKYANLSELEVQFYYSKLPFSGTTNPPDTKWLNAHTSLAAGSGEGVAPDGSYYRKIDQLTPKAKYYYKQVIIVKGTTTVLATNFDATATFNSTEGYVPAGSAQEKSLEDKKTYNLLAPWPGLSKLMDPDLCFQKKNIDKTIPMNSICDINGFLNFAFKMLIGLTAVVLVLRLMYEGYQYIVTDVPFLKASAKSGFMTALTGLLLALSAYLILNTINPKLVSNTFNVANVSVGVDLIGDGDGEITLGTNTTGLPAGVYCPGSGGLNNIPQIAKSFVGKVSYSMSARGKMRPDGDINLDCSSYVSQVLKCAGYSIPGVADKLVNTTSINSKGEKVTAVQISNNQLLLNGKAVKAGDVFGWTTPKDNRHVVMSLGGTKIIDVHGGTGNTDNAKEMDINFYMNVRNYKIQYVYRLPI